MRIYRTKVSKMALDNMLENEGSFYILLGHFANEINVLNKLFFYSENHDSSQEWITRAQTTQAQVIAKTLVGKLWEGWQLLNKAYYATKLSKKYDSLLPDNSKQALQQLNRYFSKENLINTVRNNFCFHYPTVDEVASILDSICGDEEWDVYLARTNANALYYASEAVINRAFLEKIQPGNHQKALDRIAKETHFVVKNFLVFINGCMQLIAERYLLNEQGSLEREPIDMDYLPSIKDIVIPYFTDDSEVGK